jgi:DNA-binding FrmR family transcriptional regulator
MSKSTKPKNLRTLYKRANVVGGQLFSIEDMVREKRSHEEILNLLLAIDKAVNNLIYEHFNIIIRLYLAARINDLSGTGNQSPSFEHFIDRIRENFPEYKLRDLPKVFYDLRQFNL